MEAFKVIVIFLVMVLLTSCMSVASSGLQVLYDRNNLQKKLNDKLITYKAYQSIYYKTDRYKNTHVSVSTLNNQVLLSGEVPTKAQQNEIELIAKSLEGVEKVYNLTRIAPPSSPLTRMSDTWISTKITTKLIADDRIDPSKILVVTENGTVYLMGTVLPEEDLAATQIVESTDGVQEITKLFSHIQITPAIPKRFVS